MYTYLRIFLILQAKCNVGVCDFDGGDCEKICDDVTSENISCQDVFKNGICNPECNSLECLQDGIDCRQNLPFCPDRYVRVYVYTYLLTYVI